MRNRILMLAVAVGLIAWMNYWAKAYVEASGDLVRSYAAIANEHTPVSRDPQLDENGNAELAMQVMEMKRVGAIDARSRLESSKERARHSRFMLTTASLWASVAFLFAAMIWLVRGYRLRRNTKKA